MDLVGQAIDPRLKAVAKLVTSSGNINVSSTLAAAERFAGSQEMDVVGQSLDPRVKSAMELAGGGGVAGVLFGDGGSDDADEDGGRAWNSPDKESLSIDDVPVEQRDEVAPVSQPDAPPLDEEVENYIEEKWQLHGHHPWPKYLGGPEDQELYYLPKIRHDYYHYLIKQVAPEDCDYENMDYAERMEIFREVIEVTKEFDAEQGTDIYNYMVRNRFPVR